MPTAFFTGSGNIYNLSTSSFTLTNTAPFALGTVVLQTRTIGSEGGLQLRRAYLLGCQRTHSLAAVVSLRTETAPSARVTRFFALAVGFDRVGGQQFQPRLQRRRAKYELRFPGRWTRPISFQCSVFRRKPFVLQSHTGQSRAVELSVQR